MNMLKLYATDPIDSLDFPDMTRPMLTPSSSALEVFTDFQKTEPLAINIHMSVVQAHAMMLASHVRMMLILENDDHFTGVLSLSDIDPQEILKKVSLGHTREELTVRDFMRTRINLKAFSFDELKKATIADIIRALENSGEQHCLVIDRDSHRIRGVISASDIARKLHLPINISRKSSFAGLFNEIYHPRREKYAAGM